MPLSIEPPAGLPGEEEAGLERLRDALVSAGRGGAASPDLVERFAGELSESEVLAGLADLERRGEAVEWNRRWYALRFTSWRVGRLETLRGGRALVRTGAAGEAGYLLRRGDLNGGRDGDLVLVRPRRPKRRRHYSLPEASVSKILERRWKTMVGRLVEHRGRWELEPFDSRARLQVRLEEPTAELERRLREFDYVVVELLDRPAGEGRAWGRLVEHLGSVDETGVDVLAVLRHFEIPEEFPPAVTAAAVELPEAPSEEDRRGRLDLSERLIVTIDGASARDFDDAISVEESAGGGFELGVHIADVAHYVGDGSALDAEAYRRGTSVYFPDRAVPMLPEALSNGLCSLKPKVPRLTMSVFLDIDRAGEIVKRRFAASWIRSSRRLTYSEVAGLLAGDGVADEAKYGPLLDLLRRAEVLMKLLLDRRLKQGALDLDLPEVSVALDERGRATDIHPAERTVAHRIIEEFMIAANEAVATELAIHEVPAVHRLHEAPGADSYQDLRSAVAAVGFTLPDSLESQSPEPLQRLLAKVEGRPQQALVSTLVLRTMRRAVYSTADAGHFALARMHYAHFTSPIRRYPDLIVHRQLKRRIEERSTGALHAERLDRIAAWSSQTERRAESAERELVKWKKIRYLDGRAGERFAGRITGVQPFGLFVQLDDLLVDGLIPVRAMTDDFYLFEEDRQRLVGEATGRVFRLGDGVEIVLGRVNVGARVLDFGLPEMSAPRRTGDDPAGRRGRRSGRRGRP